MILFHSLFFLLNWSYIDLFLHILLVEGDCMCPPMKSQLPYMVWDVDQHHSGHVPGVSFTDQKPIRQICVPLLMTSSINFICVRISLLKLSTLQCQVVEILDRGDFSPLNIGLQVVLCNFLMPICKVTDALKGKLWLSRG